MKSILVYGHRGAMGEAPENTLVGFRHAYEKAGVRNFEFDLRLTRDGELAVLHDELLDRTTNGRGSMGERSLEELRSLDARAFFPNSKPARIPSLEEVLGIYARDIGRFQIEIKPDLPEKLDRVCLRLRDCLKAYGIEEKTTVTSFEPYALKTIKRLNAGLKLGLISYHYTDAILETALSLGCIDACIPLKAGNRELVRKARDKGLDVTGWLGNTAEDIDELLAWGVNEITTNFPSFAIPYLKTKGLEVV